MSIDLNQSNLPGDRPPVRRRLDFGSNPSAIEIPQFIDAETGETMFVDEFGRIANRHRTYMSTISGTILSPNREFLTRDDVNILSPNREFLPRDDVNREFINRIDNELIVLDQLSPRSGDEAPSTLVQTERGLFRQF